MREVKSIKRSLKRRRETWDTEEGGIGFSGTEILQWGDKQERILGRGKEFY